tara:strand:+ start:83 stop:706 length:624 start_codon:yes stop_codon:yes gene_type:complete
VFIKEEVVHMTLGTEFILASSSASRLNILKSTGLKFKKIKPFCDEENIKLSFLKLKKNKKRLAEKLAKEKALSISIKNHNKLVVGSDTVIIFQNKIINKAKNIKVAKKNLQLMSGKKHKIISSASVCYNGKQVWSGRQQSTVVLRKLNKAQIDKYLKKTGKQILSSVGCYQAEKLGPQIIKSIKGDFFNVLGFPLFPFLKFLSKTHK